MPSTGEASSGQRLNSLLRDAGLASLGAGTTGKFEGYLSLLMRWNAGLNLTAIRDSEGILSRHFVESIACAANLPVGIATLLDFGSGAGFPGIPIALCRPEIAVMLAESQGKKAAFLHEAVRTLGISVAIHSGRAELLATRFDCVTLRAVDRMEFAVQAATRLVRAGGWLAVMTTEGEVGSLKEAAGEDFVWIDSYPLPGSDLRRLVIAQAKVS